MVFRVFFAWKLIDFVAFWFHIASNLLIAYFALATQVSVFFFVQIVIIAYFYVSFAWRGNAIVKEMGSC